MSKASNRIVLILGLLSVGLFSGCGVTSTSLPSNLQPNGGGGTALTLLTTAFADGIQGRAYNLQLSTTGGTGNLNNCNVISGTLPTGLSWSVNPLQLNVCILSGTITGAAGVYNLVVQATDSGGKVAQLPYTFTVRNDFSICAGPASALPPPYSTSCNATSAAGTTTAFPDGVQGRSYGMSPLSQLVVTNLNTTADASPVGHASEFGNGPLAATSNLAGLAGGMSSTVTTGQGNVAVTSTAVTGAPNTYTVMVSVTDTPIMVSTQSSPVVPARTATKMYTLVVHPPAQLTQSLGTTWPDAVNGRPYGTGTGCAGGACAPAVYTASNGLGNYSWPGTIPASLSGLGGMSCVAAGNTYTCSSSKITGGPSAPGAASTPLTITALVNDGGNTATPPATATTDPQSSITSTLVVDAPLLGGLTQATVTGTNPASLLPGVVNRTYGAIGAPPTYTAAGGLGAGAAGVAAYAWCLKTGTLPTGLGPNGASISTSCPNYFSTGVGTLALTANPLTGAANNYAFTLQLDDVGNSSTPGSSSTSTSAVTATSLVVNPVLMASVTQTGNAAAATTLLDGVVNRSYGVINAGGGAPVYSATGGLGSSGSYLWCLKPGSTLPAGMTGISASCGTGTSTAASSVKLTAAPTGGAGGSFAFTVQADDGGNAAVPSTFAVPTADSSVGPTALTIHPQIAIAPSNLYTTPPDAVTGRTYGAPARTDLTYTVPTGQGLAPITMTGTGFPAPIACPTTNGTQQLNCNSGNAAVTGATSTGTIIAADTANAATPAATTATDPGSQRATDTVNVRAALALTPPGAPLAAAVVGRSWGQGSACGAGGTTACVAAVYAVANGLGGYTAGPVTAGPLSCTFASTGTFTGNYTCSSASEAATPPSAAVALSVTDTANVTTPSGTTTDNSETLPINAALSLTPPATVPTAVNLRSYGSAATGCSGGACVPLSYTVANGLGSYTANATLTTAAGTFACPLTATVYNCSSTSITGAGGTAPALSLSVTEAGNASTPGGTVTDNSKTLAINSELTVTPPALVPPAVQGRAYGVGIGCSGPGGNCAPLQYSLSNGLGNYSLALSSLTTTSDAFTCTLASPVFSCNKPAIVGAANLALTFTGGETGNASTPGNSVTDTSKTLNASPEMTFTGTPATPFADAVAGRTYGQGSLCGAGAAACTPLAYSIQSGSGLGGYTYTFSPGIGFVCTNGAATSNCTSAAVTGGANSYATAHVSVADAANASTPSNTISSTNGSLTVHPEIVVTPPAAVATAVHGRAYGTGAGCSGGACAPLQYSLANGLGNYTLTGSSLTAGSDTFACTLASPTFSCSEAAIAGVGGTNPTLTFTGAETGNAATPAHGVADTSKALAINSEMTVTPPAVVPPAVQARAYGTGVGCSGGACLPLQYSVSNGLGNYTLAGSSLTTPSDTFACSLASPNFSCNKTSITGSTTQTLTFTVAETGNVSTPGNSITNAAKSLAATPEMNFTATPPSPFADAVAARTYGVGSTCGAAGTAACTPLAFTIQSGTGLGGYTYAFSPSIGFTCSSGAATSNCTSAGVTGGANTYATAHVSVTDAANASTPSNTIASSNGSLTVHGEINFTATPTSPFADAVDTRTYGQGSTCGAGGAAACNPLTYTIQNNTGLGGYSYALVVGGNNGGYACTAGGTSSNCTSASVTAAAGTFNTVHAAVSDTANSSTPGNTIASTNGSLTVHTELTITPPAGVLPLAVTGRTYGQGSTCGAGGATPCATINYSVSNGLGGYAPTATMTTTAGTFSCPLSSTTYQCSSANITGSGTPTLSLTVTDAGNGSTPGNTKTDNTKTLPINPELNFTATPPSPFADGVAGRTYGVGSTCGAGGATACAPLVYTIQSGSGLGGYNYAFSPSIGFACSSGAATSNCTSATITGGANTYATAHTSVTDTANASTPSNTVSSSNGSLTVHGEMSFTATPPSPFADAVTSRAYGQTSTCGALGTAACVPLAYSIQSNSGLGGYSYAMVVGANNGGYACTAGGTSSNCSSGAVTASAGTIATVHAAVSDTANASTPSNTIPSANGSLTVHSDLTITPPGGPIPAGVTGRTYGQGSTCGAAGNVACSTINYTVSNGLGNYVTPATMTTTAGTFSCPLSTATYQCSSANITASSSTGLSLNVSETGNGSTPGTSKTDNSQTLTINPEMNFTAIPTSPFATAVIGRAYGQGSNCGATNSSPCAPLTYTIQSGSGLGGYSYALTFGADNGGFTCTSGSTSSNCTSAGVTEATGTYSAVNVAVTDTANGATPSKTVTSSNGSFTVNAGLALNSPSSPYPDGENNTTYGSAGSGCAPGNVACTPITYTVPFVNPTIEGLPPYAFSTSGFPTNLNCNQSNAGAPAPNGTILTCAASSGISAPGPFPQTFNPVVQVKDTANASVASAAVTSTPASLMIQPQLSILDTVLPNGLVGFPYNPSGPGVTIKSQGGIGSVTWVGPGDGASGACAAPVAATLPGTTAMTFNDATQVFSTGGTAYASTDASAADGAYTFQVCVTDTGNAATPQTGALPNPGASAPLVANKLVFDVLNTYAYTPELSTNAVDVINTATSLVVGTGISLGVAPTAHPNGVAVTPDGTRAYVTLSNNKFAVIDTITNAQITGSPFAMPAGSTCTSLAGVAVTNDGRAYIACPTSSGTGGVVDVVGTTDNATLVSELATGNMPSGVAISPTVDGTTGKTSQVYVGLQDVNELLVITNSTTPAVSSTVALNGTNTAPLGLAAVVAGTDVYVYIAKTGAGTGNPGIEVVDASTSSQVSEFGLILATRAPVGVAATPDGTEVYVTVNDSTVGTSYVSVLNNGVTPTQRSVIPYGLPDPTVTPPADTGAAGVAIPPLAGATPDFLIFIAQSISQNIAVLLDNQGVGNKPLVQPAVALNGATPAPQGIANIPVPSVIPKLP